MSNQSTSFSNPLADEPSTVGEKLSDTAAQVKDKVSDLGRTAVNTIDENRDAAASGLEKAASALHEKAESLPGGEKVSSLAHGAAEKLNSTAGYVREHNVNRMMADVETLVKNNPGPSILAAVVIGFLAGRAFSSND
ncbi:MAG TPA: hypothetical protein VK638_09330 [Edaphobacter sp.]|nr:hypothetical protein [Edaphobacter sp.]